MYYKYYNKYLNNNFFYFYTGNLLDVYTLYILKNSSTFFGFTNINNNMSFNVDLKKYFIFNSMVSNFDLHNTF